MNGPSVVFVSHTPEVSGAEFVLLDITTNWPGANAFIFERGQLSERLSQQGLNVTIAKSGAGLGGFRRDRVSFAIVARLLQIAGLIRELVDIAAKNDVVYANSQKAFTLCAVAALFSRRPLVWHLHDILTRAHFGALQLRMQIWLANTCASAVIVPSQAAAGAFQAAGGRAALIHVVPNGRDIAIDPRGKSELRLALGLPSGLLVGVFSRLAPWKGQDVLIRALALCPELSCCIVGDALFGEVAYANSLRSLVNELGVSDRVHFMGRRDEVSVLMQAVDLVVHPSVEAEPFGLTLIEAMSAGTAVVASDAGASMEILDDGRCGTLFAAGDSAALANVMRSVLANPQETRAKSEAGRARALSNYSVSRMSGTIAHLISDQSVRAKTCN